MGEQFGSAMGCHLHAKSSLNSVVFVAMNCRKQGPKYVRQPEGRRNKSLKVFANFVEVAKAVRKGGGTISFELPRYRLGWTRPPVMDCLASLELSSVLIDGCDFGMTHTQRGTD